MDFNQTEAGLISGMVCNKLAGMKVTEPYHYDDGFLIILPKRYSMKMLHPKSVAQVFLQILTVSSWGRYASCFIMKLKDNQYMMNMSECISENILSGINVRMPGFENCDQIQNFDFDDDCGIVLPLDIIPINEMPGECKFKARRQSFVKTEKGRNAIIQIFKVLHDEYDTESGIKLGFALFPIVRNIP